MQVTPVVMACGARSNVFDVAGVPWRAGYLNGVMVRAVQIVGM